VARASVLGEGEVAGHVPDSLRRDERIGSRTVMINNDRTSIAG
jgi:hypothetical protein